MQVDNRVTTEVIGNRKTADNLTLLGILADVTKTAANSLTREERLAELEQWDSLAALDFVLAIEKLFDVTLEVEAVVNCELVGDLVDLAAQSAANK
jgi:acyl carrier protein